MFNIKSNKIENLSKNCHSKKNLGKNNLDIYEEYIKSMWNKRDLIDSYTEYEMCHWINFNDRYIKNKKANNPNLTTYKRGDILFVDLGAVNFSFEPSFTHPCIVLKNEYNMLFVAPCSSKKYNQPHNTIISAEISDGFAMPTGIQMNALRFISKNRVIYQANKVSPHILDKIDDYLLLNLNKKHKLQLRNLQNENNELKKQFDELKEQFDELKEQSDELKKQSDELKKQSDGLKEQSDGLNE